MLRLCTVTLSAALLGCATTTPSPESAPSAPAPASASPSAKAAPTAPTPSARALFARGNSEYDAKDYAACAATFDAGLAVAKAGKETEDHAYASACCHALAGSADQAFTRLNEAAAAGFRDAAHLQQDPDLASLRDDARWGSLLESVRASEERYLATINPELKTLHDADQADRSGKVAWTEVAARDAQRRARVAEIVAAGGAKAADDWFHAALVFQHGSTPEDLERAHEYAGKAMELNPDNGRARWLYAASKDRLLMRQQKPQLYGTQFTKVDGQWVLHPVDPSITDEERARFNVPPLELSRQRAEQMNARAAPQ